MSKVVTTIQVESNSPIEVEDIAVKELTPFLKKALFPGMAILPRRKLIVIIEVLEEN